MALNKHRLLSYITMGEMVVNLALSIFLAPILGIIGVAIGTAVPRVIVKVMLEPLLLIRVSGVGVLQYISALLIPIGLVVVFVLLPLSLGVQERILTFNWIEVIVFGAVYAVAMLCAGVGVAYVVDSRLLKLGTDPDAPPIVQE
ncbi:MAG: polysaccharide biosynthesis C-terminal domain-containing protein, partial [Pseudomonadota bacterium]